MPDESVVYEVLADAHGIEGFFILESKPRVSMALRAMANRQRHAVYAQVTMNAETFTEVSRLVLAQQYKEALVYLKEHALSVGFPENVEAMYRNSWQMIPNDRLDPYYIE